jgi:hypothetical protein
MPDLLPRGGATGGLFVVNLSCGYVQRIHPVGGTALFEAIFGSSISLLQVEGFSVNRSAQGIQPGADSIRVVYHGGRTFGHSIYFSAIFVELIVIQLQRASAAIGGELIDGSPRDDAISESNR